MDPKKTIADAWLAHQSSAAPKGYSVAVDGIRANGRVVSLTPVVPEFAFSDPGTGQGFLRLAWLRNGRIRRRLVSRADLSAGRFGSLAEMGLDLGSHNRQSIIRFFRAVEGSRLLPWHFVSKQCGWDQEMKSFLWGEQCITAGGVVSSDPCGNLADATHLSPAAPMVYVEGMGQAGTFEGWLKAARQAMRHPRVALAIFAAAAPPLLRILGASNLGVQWSGPGGSGKSSCAKLAASAWGNPDPCSLHPYLLRWGSDRKWLEQASITMRDLPVILDDASEGLDRWSRAGAILAGASEGRVERGVPIPSERWATCLIASGVQGLNDDCPDELAGRLFDFWGPPFGGQGQEVSEIVAEIQEGIQSNYGHFGPLLVQRLLQKKELWPKWKAKYLEIRKELISWGAGISGPASRIAQHLATMRTVALLVKNLFPELEVDSEPTMRDLKDWIERSASHAPKSAMALERVREWMTLNQGRILGLHEAPEPGERLSVPPGGWIGRTDQDGKVWIMQGLLSESLTEWGYVPEKCLREWWAAGELLPGKSGRAVVHQWLGKFNRPCIGFVNK